MSRLLRVMVTGGRDYDTMAAAGHVHRVLDRLHAEEGIEEVIHGACGWNADDETTWTRLDMIGADAMADDWAEQRMIRVVRKPAHWTTQRRAAGPRRNAAMVAMGPDVVVAFPGGPGTAGAMKLAREAGLRVIDETNYEPADMALPRQSDPER